MPLGAQLFRMGMICPPQTPTPLVIGSGISGDGSEGSPLSVSLSSIGAHRAQSSGVYPIPPGGTLALDFTTHLSLYSTLAANIENCFEPVGLTEGMCGVIVINLNGFIIPAYSNENLPHPNSAVGIWDVSGSLVRILVHRINNIYIWTADTIGG